MKKIRLISPRDAAIILIITGISGASAFFLRPERGASAVIEKDGRTICTVSLSSKDGEFILPETDDTVFEISDGAIRIKSSDCAEQVCVRRGFISGRGETVVCIPQKLIITVTDGGEEFDAVVG